MPFLAGIPAALGIGGGAAAASGAAAAGGISWGTVLQAAGAAVGAISAYQAANFQSKIAKMNADIARDNAARSIEVSQIEQQDQDARTTAAIGEQLAVQSASGLSLGGRSQILSRKTAAELGRKDALNVRYAGEVKKYNYLNEANNQDASAQLAQQQGTGSLLGGFLKAGSIIGSARPSRSVYNRFNPSPVPRPSSLGY